MKKEEKVNGRPGLALLIICGIIAILIVVVSLLFPEKIVNFFK